jgi:hypothetical protein
MGADIKPFNCHNNQRLKGYLHESIVVIALVIETLDLSQN